MGRKYQYSTVIEAFIQAEPSVEAMCERIYEQVQRERAETPLDKAFRRGQARIVERQLRLKFGALSPDVCMQLERASGKQLECWAERVLYAAALDAVFRADVPE